MRSYLASIAKGWHSTSLPFCLCMLFGSHLLFAQTAPMQIVGITPKMVLIQSPRSLPIGEEITVTRAGSEIGKLKVVKVEGSPQTGWVLHAEILSQQETLKLSDTVVSSAQPEEGTTPQAAKPEEETPFAPSQGKPGKNAPAGREKEGKTLPDLSSSRPIFTRPSAKMEKHYETDKFREGAAFGLDEATILFNLAHAAAKESVEKLHLPTDRRVGLVFLYSAESRYDRSLLPGKGLDESRYDRSLLPGKGGATKFAKLFPGMEKLLPWPLFAEVFSGVKTLLPWPVGDWIPFYSLFSRKQTHQITAAADMPGLPPYPEHWNFVYDALVHQLHNVGKANVVELSSRYYFLHPDQIVGGEDPLRGMVELAREAEVDLLLLGTLGGSVVKTGQRRIPFYQRDYFAPRINLTLRVVDVRSGEVISSSIGEANDTVRTASRFQFRDLAELIFLGLLARDAFSD